MKKVKIESGICGFTTTVTAKSDDEQTVKLAIESDCKNVQKMVSMLPEEIDAFEACLTRPGAGIIYECANKACPHAACPVPSGIIKCIEAECMLALPKAAHITFIEEN